MSKNQLPPTNQPMTLGKYLRLFAINTQLDLNGLMVAINDMIYSIMINQSTIVDQSAFINMETLGSWLDDKDYPRKGVAKQALIKLLRIPREEFYNYLNATKTLLGVEIQSQDAQARPQPQPHPQQATNKKQSKLVDTPNQKPKHKKASNVNQFSNANNHHPYSSHVPNAPYEETPPTNEKPDASELKKLDSAVRNLFFLCLGATLLCFLGVLGSIIGYFKADLGIIAFLIAAGITVVCVIAQIILTFLLYNSKNTEENEKLLNYQVFKDSVGSRFYNAIIRICKNSVILSISFFVLTLPMLFTKNFNDVNAKTWLSNALVYATICFFVLHLIWFILETLSLGEDSGFFAKSTHRSRYANKQRVNVIALICAAIFAVVFIGTGGGYIYIAQFTKNYDFVTPLTFTDVNAFVEYMEQDVIYGDWEENTTSSNNEESSSEEQSNEEQSSETSFSSSSEFTSEFNSETSESNDNQMLSVKKQNKLTETNEENNSITEDSSSDENVSNESSDSDVESSSDESSDFITEDSSNDENVSNESSDSDVESSSDESSDFITEDSSNETTDSSEVEDSSVEESSSETLESSDAESSDAPESSETPETPETPEIPDIPVQDRVYSLFDKNDKEICSFKWNNQTVKDVYMFEKDGGYIFEIYHHTDVDKGVEARQSLGNVLLVLMFLEGAAFTALYLYYMKTYLKPACFKQDEE